MESKQALIDFLNEQREKELAKATKRYEKKAKVIALINQIPEDSPLHGMILEYLTDEIYIDSHYGEVSHGMEGVKWFRDTLRDVFGAWSDSVVGVSAETSTELSVTYEGIVDEIMVRFVVCFDLDEAREAGILSEDCEIRETETKSKSLSVMCGGKTND